LREQIAKLRVAVDLAQSQVAPEITAALVEARALRATSLESELAIIEGDDRLQSNPVGALSSYHAGAHAAERAGREDLVALARVKLVHVLGYMLSRTDEASEWADYAQDSIDHLGDAGLAASLDYARGTMLEHARQSDKALALHQKALAYYQEHSKGREYRVARALNSVAIDLADLYRVGESLDYFHRTLAMYEQLLGPESRRTVMAKSNLGAQLRNAGKTVEARALLEDVVARRTRTVEPDSMEMVSPLLNLGRALGDLGRYDEGAAALRRAVAIAEKRLGPESGQLVLTLSDFASALTGAGRSDEALTTAQHAIAVGQKAFGEHDARLSDAFLARSRIYEELGRCRDALTDFDREQELLKASGQKQVAAYLIIFAVTCQIELGQAKEALAEAEPALADARKRLPDGSLFVADYALGVSRARFAVGDAAGAVAPAEEAITVLTALGVIGPRLAKTRFALAQALWESRPSERAHATTLARQALADAGSLHHTRDSIARWLKNR
jgi:tetratricopeptide (TPR) repeat protein